MAEALLLEAYEDVLATCRPIQAHSDDSKLSPASSFVVAAVALDVHAAFYGSYHCHRDLSQSNVVVCMLPPEAELFFALTQGSILESNHKDEEEH